MKKAHLVSVIRDNSVGQYTGHTAAKTEEVGKKVMGGVLVIAEAYFFYCPENGLGYGQKAI